jgi:hypothetical protein
MIALEKIIEIHPELADDFRCKRFRELFNKLKELPNKSKETNNLFITTENSQKFSHSDFKPSVVWSVHYFSLLLEQLLNDRQREEWIGDLEEALYKMYEQKYPRWRLHFETLRRVFYLLKGLLIAKTNSFVYKRRTTK